jgi:hypothetical protein
MPHFFKNPLFGPVHYAISNKRGLAGHSFCGDIPMGPLDSWRNEEWRFDLDFSLFGSDPDKAISRKTFTLPLPSRKFAELSEIMRTLSRQFNKIRGSSF